MVIQGRSWIQISDNSGIRWLRVFYVYRWGYGLLGSTGFFWRGAVKIYSQQVNLKHSKHWLKRGDRVRGVLVRSRKIIRRLDGLVFYCWDNSGIVLRNVCLPRGSRFIGPICWEVQRPRLLSLFIAII